MRSVLFLTLVFWCPTAEAAARWGDWRWVTPLPQGYDLNDAVEGNGATVVVGDNGTILVNYTGHLEWGLVYLESDVDLRSVAWTGERFVAVGGDYSAYNGIIRGTTVATSEDGQSWTTSLDLSGSDFMPTLVHWNGSQVLVLGLGASVLTSGDGLDWRMEQAEQVGYLHVFTDIQWTGSRYVALSRTDYEHGQTQIMTSVDGRTWDVRLQAVDVQMGFSCLAVGGGRSVVVGGFEGIQSVLISDDDAQTWAVRNAALPPGVLDIVFDGQRFTVIGFYGDLATSRDGVTWSPPVHLALDRTPNTIVSVGPGSLILGETGMFGLVDDAGGWTSLLNRALAIGETDVVDLEREGAQLVAVTITGKIAHWNLESSSGGVTSRLASNCYEAEYAEDRFFVVCDRPASIYSSADGVDWALEYSNDASGHRLFGIAAGHDGVVAVGTSDGQMASVVVNFGSSGWTWLDLPQVASPLYSAIWNGDLFLAGGNGVIATSSDGLSWQVGDSLASPSMRFERMAQDLGRVVAIGQANIHSAIAVSGDGLSWEMTSFPSTLLVDVVRTDDYFLAAETTTGGKTAIWTSADGRVWQKELTRFYVTALEGGAQGIIASGGGVNILEATDMTPVPRRVGERVRP